MTLHEIEQKLAETQATTAILVLPAVVIDGIVWRNVTDQPIEWEVKYLRMRGLLRHHHEKPWLVQMKGMDAPDGVDYVNMQQ